MAAARKLSKARAKAAQALGDAVTAAMQELSMAGGRFAVALHPCDPAGYGLEQIEFLVAGHAGTAPRPLAKVASGGELARIALAISVITSSATATPTLIFDEVDSGIGGAVAEVVGRLLKRLGQERQVLCVTHLPQVASQANQHFQVSKAEAGNGRTVSRIEALDAKARVEEVARMLGGLEITATTRKHARELLASCYAGCETPRCGGCGIICRCAGRVFNIISESETDPLQCAFIASRLTNTSPRQLPPCCWSIWARRMRRRLRRCDRITCNFCPIRAWSRFPRRYGGSS